MPYTTLPTVEEAREFLRLVNVGREAAGLTPLERLDFDGATPDEPCNCLSARNLFCAMDPKAWVFSRGWDGSGFVVSARMPKMASAIGAERLTIGWSIPDAILRVTDPFDARIPGLRERLEEAGVV
jgi:hypothetical protein